jgi:DNA-binding GntR family transcriptional regulator
MAANGGGYFLAEAELAETLGVSRTPIREALLTLDAERLIQLVPNRGAYVPHISDREIGEVMEARALIEVFCAQRALEAGADLQAELHDLLREQESLLDQPEAFIDCDRSFHCSIVNSAGHSVLGSLYESLRDRQLRVGVRALHGQRSRAQQVLSEHRAIADAFAGGDANRLKVTIEDHIEQTLSALAVTWRPL